jgi:hypothetical protein
VIVLLVIGCVLLLAVLFAFALARAAKGREDE